MRLQKKEKPAQVQGWLYRGGGGMENKEVCLIMLLMIVGALSPLFWSILSCLRDPWLREDRRWMVPLFVVIALLILASASAAVWISFQI